MQCEGGSTGGGVVKRESLDERIFGTGNMYEGLVTVVEIEGHSEFCSKVAYTLTEWAWAREGFTVR